METTNDIPEPPKMGDEIVSQRYVFRANCPVCYKSYGEYESDEQAIREARRCYFSHDETPTADEEEAGIIGLDGWLICPDQYGGCGWEGEKREQPYSAIKFSKCPNCGEHHLCRRPDEDTS